MVVAINGPMIVEEWGTYRDGAAALPLFFAAVVLLGVGMVALVLDLPARRTRLELQPSWLR